VKSQHLTTSSLEWLFRVGYTSVFLVNSFTAILEPTGFETLMRDSFAAAFLGSSLTPWLWFIALNDFALGVLILAGRWRSAVLAWSGVWLLAVTVLKLSSLLRHL
jgi:hypothetical protein